MVKKHCCYGICRSDSRYADREHMQGVFFLPFPKPTTQLEKCKRWLSACSREDFGINNITKDTYICSLHFVGKKGPTEQHPDPIPASYNPDQVQRFQRKRKAPAERNLLPKKKKQLKLDQEVAAEALIQLSQESTPLVSSVGIQCSPLSSDQSTHACICKTTCDASTQTERSIKSDLVAFSVENTLLKNKVKLLESSVCVPSGNSSGDNVIPADAEKENSLDIDSLKNDDKKMKFYAGLSFGQFLVLWKFLGAAVNKLTYWNRQVQDPELTPTKKRGTNRKLKPENELLLTLMKLRVGLLHQDLAYRFCISTAMVSNILHTWIQFLYLEFSNLRSSMFPSRDVIKKSLPRSFKKFKNIRTIIDCTEIFVQQAADFGKQGNLYSSYKGHSTFKVLVGIAPNGAINFISDAFEGSISDKEIVKKSGFLDKLEEGDLVMADRGFTIRDLLEKKKVKLVIPPFLGQDRSRFTPQEEAQTKEIAKVRIHVERAIDRMKKFRMLKHVIPLSLAPVFSQMVFVIGCLVNFQEPLVK